MCKEILVGGGGKVILKDKQKQLTEDAKLHFVLTNKTIIVGGIAAEGDHLTLSGVALKLVIKFLLHHCRCTTEQTAGSGQWRPLSTALENDAIV